MSSRGLAYLVCYLANPCWLRFAGYVVRMRSFGPLMSDRRAADCKMTGSDRMLLASPGILTGTTQLANDRLIKDF